MFRTIEEIKQANQAQGGHWFDPDALRFFRGRVLSTVYGGRYFVSSEQYDDNTPRLYTIRQAFADGNIETVGEFQGYRTAEDARSYARKLGEFPLYVERVGTRPHYAIMRDDRDREAVTREALDSYDEALERVCIAVAQAGRSALTI